MDFYFGPPILDDAEFNQEMDCLVKEETSDLFCSFDIEKCEDIEMKQESDFDHKCQNLELFSNDVIEFSTFSKFSVINEKDIWKEKHAWAISNNHSGSNSISHLDFIGGSPESALMVNPNIVIPNDRMFYDMDDENRKFSKRTGEKHSSSHGNKYGASTSVAINIEGIRESNNSVAGSNIRGVSVNGIKLNESYKINLKTSKTRCTNKSESIHVNNSECIVVSPKSRLQTSVSHVKQEAVDGCPAKDGKSDSNVWKSNDKLNVQKNEYDSCYPQKLIYPKPAFSYSCLISMALKNSREGCLPVSEIYNFMCDNFPYFKTAPTGWKNSVRHNLSLNKCFEKIEKPPGSVQRKGCLWTLNPSKSEKMDDEVKKWTRKDREGIKKSMIYPDHLELLEKGELKASYSVKDEDEFGDEEFYDENDTELSEIEDLNVKETSLINMSDIADLPDFNLLEEKVLYEDLINNVETDKLFSNTKVTSNSLTVLMPTSNNDKKVDNEIDKNLTNTSNDDKNRKNRIVVKFYDKTNSPLLKLKKNTLKSGVTIRTDIINKKTCTAINDVDNGREDYDSEDDYNNYDINAVLRFQDISTERQHHSAKYITVNNKPLKSMKQTNKLLFKRQFPNC